MSANAARAHAPESPRIHLPAQRALFTAGLCLLVAAGAARAQERPTGVEIAGLPVIGYDSDEGVGYGAFAELHQYGDGHVAPYLWMLRSKVFLTTGGRRDIGLLFDSPALPSEAWRLTAYGGYERRVETAYYGIGNDSPYDPTRESGPDPDYYSFGRLRRIARVDVQRRLGESPLRVLLGAGLVSTEVDPVPNDEGSTLYAEEVTSSTETRWTNFLRGGVVWDSRDSESSPRRGVWSEALLQWVDEELGADVDFIRWTLIDRRYLPLHERLVVANRLLLQGVSGDAPVEQLQRFEMSFREGEGVGGSSSVRGLPRNRYAGKGIFIWNSEARLRLIDFALMGRNFHIGVSAFLDQGRVWGGAPRIREVLSDLHRGYGGGLHGGMGETFVASAYIGTSAGQSPKVYLDLGYMF